jgi:hypothetical protein
MMMAMAGGLAGPLAVTACAHPHHDYDRGERAYVWTDAEGPYYTRWESETRREHRDYSQRSADEQRDYWEWRRAHGDRDHGDRDRDNR